MDIMKPPASDYQLRNYIEHRSAITAQVTTLQERVKQQERYIKRLEQLNDRLIGTYSDEEIE